VSYTITHRMGQMETDPPLNRLRELVAELDVDDPEHPDIAVSHESGWTLRAYPDGLVVWENAGEDDEPRHVRNLPRQRVVELFLALAQGEIAAVEQEAWSRGYP
jgi:hypothetical protein